MSGPYLMDIENVDGGLFCILLGLTLEVVEEFCH